MAGIRFEIPAGAVLDETDVRALADRLERQRGIASQSAATKLMEAVALPEKPARPIHLYHHELLALRDALREVPLDTDGPSAAAFRTALEQWFE